MRLGQLARKYGVSKKDIISYLKDKDPTLHSLGQNTKLDENTVKLIAVHFEDSEDLLAPSLAEATDGEQEQLPSQVQEQSVVSTPGAEPQPPEHQEEEPSHTKPSDGEAIETDKLLELLEDEEKEVDLSKITLIKAPKKELEGLKVVGKIELPEPRKKPVKPKEQAERDSRRKGAPLSEEEKEKRRLRAKRKKEAYEARQEKRRKAKEKERLKALNRARYQAKLQRAKVNQIKPKPHQPKEEAVAMEAPPAPPKTLLGKLWRWLTTY